MESKKFIQKCKALAADYITDYLEGREDQRVTAEDVYVVWYCKTLQNHKALLSAPPHGAPYIEFTFNGDKGELYMDVYVKNENICAVI